MCVARSTTFTLTIKWSSIRVGGAFITTGGVGTLPLAPLCRMPGDAPLAEALPGIIQQIEQRLRRDASPEEARRLLTAAFVLTGLKVPRGVAIQLFQGV